MQDGSRGCSVTGCDRPHEGRGLCLAHYARLRKHGDLDAGVPVGRHHTGTPAERFASYVLAVPGPLDTDCHEWQSFRNPGGYGTFMVGGRPVLAHRWAWEQANGPIPDGLQLDHLCRNPPCINPAHTEPVTHRENQLRSPGLTSVTKTHCKHGHEFAPENTILTARPDGGVRRDCRICRTARQHRASARYRAKRKAA